jgi:flagellar hook-basal body complex protein FliE
MSMSISRVQLPQLPEVSKPAGKSNSGGEFASVLESAVGQVEKSRQNAADSIRQLLSGEKEELHNTVLSAQKAELEFDMFLQVRNKVVSAYQEIMKMQV